MPRGLKIRAKQMKSFEGDAEARFLHAMEDHVREFAPRLAPVAGDSGVRRFVEAGVEQSRQYGLQSRESIRFYLETGCVLGWRFDTDPQYPWAGKVLSDPALDSEERRANLLAGFLDDYLREVAGPDNQYAVKAIERLNRTYLQRANAAPALAPAQALALLQDVYPEKLAYVGAQPFRALYDQAAKSARAHGVPDGTGTSLIAAAMAGLGHGVIEDPLYPWVAGALTDTSVADPEGRVQRLYRRFKTYLQHALAHLEEG